jgi:hypothetical protein
MPKYRIAAPTVLRIVAQGTPRNAHGSIILRVASKRGETRSIGFTVAPGGWGTPHLTLDGAVPAILHAQVMVAVSEALGRLPHHGGVVSR